MPHLKNLPLIRAYLRLLERRPRTTMCLTTATLHAGGDVIAQKAIERKKNLDVVRTSRFFLIGFAWDGPLLSWWYRFLSRGIPQTSARTTVLKVALDQLLFIPFMLGSFLVINSTLRGMTPDDIKSILERDYIHLLLANYQLWPCAMMVNFYFTPVKHQVLFTNSVSLAWNTYLSWRANKELLRLGGGTKLISQPLQRAGEFRDDVEPIPQQSLKDDSKVKCEMFISNSHNESDRRYSSFCFLSEHRPPLPR